MRDYIRPVRYMANIEGGDFMMREMRFLFVANYAGKNGKEERCVRLKLEEDKEVGPFDYPAPSLVMPADMGRELLQDIVDRAWDMGVRPYRAKETTPELNALKGHLEDMRSITFSKLKVDKPGKK